MQLFFELHERVDCISSEDCKAEESVSEAVLTQSGRSTSRSGETRAKSKEGVMKMQWSHMILWRSLYRWQKIFMIVKLFSVTEARVLGICWHAQTFMKEIRTLKKLFIWAATIFTAATRSGFTRTTFSLVRLTHHSRDSSVSEGVSLSNWTCSAQPRWYSALSKSAESYSM